ncbi:MAG: dihydrolipoyl dehydrogenase [Clostridiaceae bacterium]|nr:dihydrolipoyl dehydrogenase [Clostridiaceae bacterium]
MSDYQLVIIGAGPGGYVSAIKAAQLGLKTALIENRDVGGTCLNRGCIPTKTLLHSAQVYEELRTCTSLGITAEGLSFDMGKISERKDEVVSKLRGGIEQLLKANKIDLIRGTGIIVSEGIVKISSDGEEREISSENILIATGSVPARPPIEGLDLSNVVTSDELLDKKDGVYPRLLIIGGGVIGVEFASVYHSLGCEVTIVEALDRILPTMEREISQNLSMIFKKRGVKLFTSSKVKRIKQADDGSLCCEFASKETSQSAYADGILVAIGRRPNTKGLLGSGVELEMERGRIVTGDHFETSMKNVYAIGDVTSKIQLAHVASAQGIVVSEIIAGKEPSVDLNVVPACIYTNPEIASVGITSDDAKAQGIAIKTGKFIMSGNGKSLIEEQDRGFIKIISEEATGKILGAQLMCARATDIVSELSSAIVSGLTVENLSKVIRPHPTFTEAVSEALEDIEGHAVHIAPKR